MAGHHQSHRQPLGEKTRQVTITFDRDIGFGTSIVFMPKFRFLWPGQEHPIAEELRDLLRPGKPGMAGERGAAAGSYPLSSLKFFSHSRTRAFTLS